MIEKVIEKGLFASRWLMAPFYIGLVTTLVLLMYQFGKELVHLFLHAGSATESDVILGVLALIDLSLSGNLVLIVVFTGYENFVSKFDVDDHKDRPDWHGTVDFAGLKLKLITSMVAISGIQLLKMFMDVAKFTDRDITWALVIHGVFLASGVMLALMDKLSGHGASITNDASDH
jgi:uncharacterized protein (TIGR00645 family)